MAFSPDLSEIFITPILQSALHLLATHIQKQPPSSSLLHSQLKKLHQSLFQLANKQLKFNTQLLTQLKDVAYDASELVDDLEYEALRQEVEEFNRLNPNKPVTGPSISQFRGLQTGDPHTNNRGEGGNPINQIQQIKGLVDILFVSPSKSKRLFSAVPAFDSVDAQDVSCSGAIEDRIAIIVEKLDYFAANLEGTTDQDNNNEVVSPVITGDVCAANNIVDESVQQEVEELIRTNTNEPITCPSVSGPDIQNGDDDDITQVPANLRGGKSRGKFLPKLKSLISEIGKMCKCFDGRDVRKKTSTTPNHDSTEDKDNDIVGGLNGVVNKPVINEEVYWGDYEKEEMVKMLLDPGKQNVSIIPIIGKGGVGKTTLAHSIYSDERVEKYFHMREWICASDTFDMMRIAGELEESLYLSGPFDQLQLLNLYERNLMSELKGKRFLLVLDDVRSEDWALRFAAIDTNVKGSKILLTAREDWMLDEESKRNKIVLKGMRSEEFWALFKKCSFGDEDPNTYPDLEGIGRGITEKLQRFPLAAKLVGGALREKLNCDHWMKILQSELLESGKACGDCRRSDVMLYLRLSFQHLPLQLQRCFIYSSVFPKGYAFQIDKLVQIWMAQGLILMEDAGREYFDHLLSRSFFDLPCYTKSYWKVKYYLMPELLHELAESVCLDDIVVYEGTELDRTQRAVRHLSVSLWDGLNSEFEWKNLQTLIINTKHCLQFEVLKRIRVLDLSHSYMTQLPDSIGNLIHLRYLNLYGNYIFTLPESLCKLYHLQSLILPLKCVRLPKGITNLINLRHLNASEVAISRIAGIGRLTHLQELSVFNVRRVKGHDIGQLKCMKELRGSLCINYLDDVKNNDEVLESNLKDKVHIRGLQLKWMRWNPKRNPDAHRDVLEHLKPPSGLKELEIHWYRGPKSPSWFVKESLPNLKVIILRGCEKWNHLPCFWKLPFLEVLKLEFMNSVIEVAGKMVEVFPSLKELWLNDSSVTFEGMPVVSEQGHKLFPCLCKLVIQNCERVKGLPPISMLQTLEELDVRKCPDLDAEIPGCLINLTSLETLKISQLQLTYFPGEIFKWLKKLEIDSCEHLESWIANEKEEEIFSSLTSLCITDTLLPTGPVLNKYFTSLHELRIERCSKLTSFTDEQQRWFKELTSLRELSILDCKSLRSLPRDLCQLHSLEKLTISGCPNIRSLPSSLPSSLKVLEISNCNPGFAVLWQEGRAPDWVSRVPYRYIA